MATIHDRVGQTVDMLVPLAKLWSETPEALGTGGAMLVAFVLPSLEQWRERLADVDEREARAVAEAVRELAAWHLDADDQRSAEELGSAIVGRLVEAGIIQLGGHRVPPPGGDLWDDGLGQVHPDPGALPVGGLAENGDRPD